MLTIASKLLIGIQAKLTPQSLKYLGQLLVRHWPLLWRSRLLWALWSSLLLAMLGLAVGLLTPTLARNVWSIGQINLLHSLFQLAGLTLICIGAYLQWRAPLAGITHLKQLQLALFNSLAVMVLMLQPSTLLFTTTYQTSKALEWNYVSNEYLYHEAYDFWHCSDRLPNELQPSQTEKLTPLLKKLGLKTYGSIKTTLTLPGYDAIKVDNVSELVTVFCDDPKGKRFLVILDLFNKEISLAAFGEKLQSIYFSHKLWKELTGPFAESIILWMSRPSSWLIMAIILWLINQPEIRWRQIQSFNQERLNSDKWVLPKPNWLVKNNHELLRKQPVLWASRTHLFIYDVLLFGFVGSSIIALLFVSLFNQELMKTLSWFFGEGSVLSLLLFITFPMLLPTLWLATNRCIPVIVSAPMSTSIIVRHHLLVTLAIGLFYSLISTLSGMYLTKELPLVLCLTLNLSVLVLSVAVIFRIRSLGSSATVLMINFALLFVFILMMIALEDVIIFFDADDRKNEIELLSAILYIIILSILSIRARATKSVITNTIAVAATPALHAIVLVSLIMASDLDSYREIDFANKDEIESLLTSLFSLSIFPLYLLISQPAIHNLVLAAYEPKST